MDRTPAALAHRAVDPSNLGQRRCGHMEAGRGWSCQPLGKEGGPGDQGRVAPLRPFQQGVQGQLSRGMRVKRQ
eukprot:3644693-Heterocapsa_arctica.AAC.1